MPEIPEAGPTNLVKSRVGATAAWILLTVIAEVVTESPSFLLLMIVPVFWSARRPVLVTAAVAALALCGCGAPPESPPLPTIVDAPVATTTGATTAPTTTPTTTAPTTKTAPANATSLGAPARPPAPVPRTAKPKPATVKTAPPAPKPTRRPKPPAPARSCDPSYPTVCIAPAPPDLDCGQVPYRKFVVRGADPHGFDSDNDGVGCES